ncbi:hypothetical protein [Curtobacterium sp. MCJR17_043]|uniref:hypothetical protein n=1 Tax=Curtobacterium sp. MCJR17_043 TaxID=2175660 RepID=UPI0024DF83C3|nr:hypothetical protein [Curtobacterium sp. MCJR17_043]WIB36426.1 hypothetical protein DEJ15_04580 [Curtobacterium sp. MCJR17_043]
MTGATSSFTSTVVVATGTLPCNASNSTDVVPSFKPVRYAENFPSLTDTVFRCASPASSVHFARTPVASIDASPDTVAVPESRLMFETPRYESLEAVVFRTLAKVCLVTAAVKREFIYVRVRRYFELQVTTRE